MKHANIISALLCLLMLFPFASALRINEVKAVYQTSGYTTYTMNDTTLKWTVETQTVNGVRCTAMQGMNVGTNYIYTYKGESNNVYGSIMRTNAKTGAQTVMKYYSSLTATTASDCNTLGHGNEIVVCGSTENGATVHHMFVATTDDVKAIARLKIDGDGLYFTGYFDLVTTSGTSVNAHALRLIKTTGGYHYFLIKRGSTFYYCKIATGDNGGTASAPTKVTLYKLFTIDLRNAVFATSSTGYSTCENLESWTTQGFAYSKSEGVVYVPMWDHFIDGSRSVIITFNVNEVITDARLEEARETTTLLYPTVTNFLLTVPSEEKFEIESCDFRTSQGTDGDLNLYFNTNSTTAANEGIFAINYKQGSGDFTPMVNESSILYTVKYNANGGVDSAPTSKFTMNSTRHIRGIKTKLRCNYFTREGYTFAGWNLTRASDGKWLYFDADGTARWYSKGSQPLGSYLALYEDRRNVSALTGVNGDTVTCYAQWTPNAESQKAFYIRYDANGGTGTMEDTKVVYGTSTATRKNTFTREGYVFSGWMGYRQSNNAWIYVNSTDFSHKWIPVGTDATGYFLKSYSNGCSLSKTSSVDTDIITFYAAWTKIADLNLPSEIVQGTAFELNGTVQSTTGIYRLNVSIDKDGQTVASKQVNPYASSFGLSGLLDFNALDLGVYTLKVTAYTYDAGESSLTTAALLDKEFAVVSPAKLMLSQAAASDVKYKLTDLYFEGFDQKTVRTEFGGLFEYEVEVRDTLGALVSDDGVIGTGYTVSCAGESRITVLRGDLNSDAFVSTVDYMVLTNAIKDGKAFEGAYAQAADLTFDSVTSSADCIAIKRALTE